MLYFNLLPLERKEELKREELYFMIGGILKTLFLILFTILLLFVSTYFSLEFLSSSQKKELEKTKAKDAMKKVLLLDSEISSKNILLGNVYEVQKELIYFSPVIEKISFLVPSGGVYITELNIEKKILGQSSSGTEGQASTTGTSPTPTATPSPTATTTASTDQSASQLQQGYYEVNLKGFAPKREQVILFEKNLKGERTFVVSQPPLQNILKSTKVDFEFTFKIKK